MEFLRLRRLYGSTSHADNRANLSDAVQGKSLAEKWPGRPAREDTRKMPVSDQTTLSSVPILQFTPSFAMIAQLEEVQFGDPLTASNLFTINR